MKLTAIGQTLGATIEGLDLAKPLSPEVLGEVMNALGQFGVIRFPSQELTGPGLKEFSLQLGELEINVANSFQEPGHPEVMILSNIVEGGKPIGLSDAGQDWHTDMSYSRQIAFANVLYGIKIPMRDGRSLGNTEFCNMHAAYDDLPAAMKRDLEGKTVSSCSTAGMIFGVAHFISRMSRYFTLHPGDVIWFGCDGATAPALQAGDLVEVVNEHIGVLSNRVTRAA